jgi:hypothetical protein
MTCSYLSGTPRSPQKHSLYRHAATKLEIYDRSSEKAAWTEPQAPKRQVESSAKPLGTGRIAEDRIAYLAISKTAHKAALSQREAAELSDTISRQGTGRVPQCKGQVEFIEGRGRILALAFPVAADRSTTIWFRMEPPDLLLDTYDLVPLLGLPLLFLTCPQVLGQTDVLPFGF